jgi:hypothetical protein
MTTAHETIDDLNLEALAALPDDAPVVMLNLMRFRDRSLDGNGSGWDAYLRYSALAINRWDYAALVRYPSRRAFIDMMTSPEYAQANVERVNGCAAHTIIAIRETYSKPTPPLQKE